MSILHYNYCAYTLALDVDGKAYHHARQVLVVCLLYRPVCTTIRVRQRP